MESSNAKKLPGVIVISVSLVSVSVKTSITGGLDNQNSGLGDREDVVLTQTEKVPSDKPKSKEWVDKSRKSAVPSRDKDKPFSSPAKESPSLPLPFRELGYGKYSGTLSSPGSTSSGLMGKKSELPKGGACNLFPEISR